MTTLFKKPWCVGLGVLLLAIGLRVIGLSSEPLWLDEINTLLVGLGHTHLPNGYPAELPGETLTAQQWLNQYFAWQPLDWGQLLGVLKENVHLPLYYVLVHPWVSWFGMGEVSLRIISVVFSVAMIWPLWQLVRGIPKPENTPRPWWQQPATWVLLFVLTNPFQLYFAQEARMYTLATCWVCFSTLGLWHVAVKRNSSWQWWGIYVLATLLGLFSHYMVWLQGVFHAAVWLWALWQANPQQRHALSLRLGLAAVVIGVPLALWWPMVAFQQAAPTLSGGEHFSEGLLKPLRYVGVLVWQPWMVMTGSALWAKIVYIPLTTIGVLAAAYWGFRKKIGWVGFIAAWAWLPLLAQIGLDVVKATHTSTIIRYGLLMGPPIMVLTAVGWAWLVQLLAVAKPMVGKAVTALVFAMVLMVGLGTVWPGSALHYRSKFPSRAMASYLHQHAHPNAAAVVNGPLAAPLSLAYEIARYRPGFPITYYVSPYRGVAYPTPVARLAGQYSETWLYRYRGNDERGHHLLYGDLRKAYPEMTKEGPESRWVKVSVEN